MTRHSQARVTVQVPNSVRDVLDTQEAGAASFACDEEIADLVAVCWLKAMPTRMSCQENQQGDVWLDFAAPEFAERFRSETGVEAGATGPARRSSVTFARRLLPAVRER